MQKKDNMLVNNLKRAQILMDRNLFKQLRRYAFHKEISISNVARQAIKKFLEEKRINNK